MPVVFKSRRDLLVRTEDGRNVVTQELIELVTDSGAHYMVPIGSTSDGCSTPPEIWFKIPPFGDYWLGAVVHDSAYRGTLQRQMENGFWVPAMLSKDAADTLFLDCMTALGVDQLTKETIYEGVHLGGEAAFQKDRQTLTPGASNP